jgi:ligand-binding sensor domain-containing protein
MIRTVIALVCIELGFASESLALSPDVSVNQLYRTSWTVRNGAPSGIFVLAQTTDGALWIGASGGLFRFDGVQFEHVTGTAHTSLLSADIRALWAAPTGGLWIGYRVGGASFLKNGELTNFAAPQGLTDGSVIQFAQDVDGVIWAATTTGLKQLSGSQWVDKTEELNAPKNLEDIAADHAGTLWICGSTGVLYLLHGEKRFESTTVPCQNPSFAASPQRDIWLIGDARINLTAWLSSPVRRQRLHDVNNINFDASYNDYAIDHDRSIWFARGSRVYHSADVERSESVSESDALSLSENGEGRAATALIVDREGDIWIGTADGIVMLRQPRLLLAHRDLEDANTSPPIVAGDSGSMWISILSNKAVSSSLYRATPTTGLLATQSIPDLIRCGFRDRTGVLWLGGVTQLWRYNEGSWTVVNGPRDIPTARNLGVQIITSDRQGALWISVVRAGVFRLESGTWTRFDSKVIPATEAATSLATDARGRIWIGYTHDRVLTVDEPPDGGGASRIHSITAKDGLQLGNILTITADGDDAWIGGENGMVRISDGRISPVIPDGSGFHSVSGIVKARNGDLWLNSNDGLIHLPVGEVKRFIENPNYRVQPEILNYLDGMPGVPSGLRMHPNIVEATDGRIWVSTSNGVAWTDTAHFHRNTMKPAVEIRRVIADGKRMEGTDAITFPKRTRNIQID